MNLFLNRNTIGLLRPRRLFHKYNNHYNKLCPFLHHQHIFISSKQDTIRTSDSKAKTGLDSQQTILNIKRETFQSEKENPNNENHNQNQNQNDQRSDRFGTRLKLMWFRFRRLAITIGIPCALFTCGMILHESDIPYHYAFQTLQKSTLPAISEIPEGTEEIANPAPMWAVYLPMFWASWVHSQRPGRIMLFWDDFMPLLDEKYHPDTRLVAVTCLLSMLGGSQDKNQPFVYYDKCLRKLEVLDDYKGSDWTAKRFLNEVYKLCGDVKNPQMVMAGLQLLLELTSIPAEPREVDVDYVLKHSAKITPNMTRELASSLLTIYQDRNFVLQFIQKAPPKKGQKAFKADFSKIKRILVQNRALDFAFQLLDSSSPQLQQMAMFILVGLVGRYPDLNELHEHLGSTLEERTENKIKLVDTLARMGQEHYVRGENEAALGAFIEAVKFLPTSAQLRFFCGKCYSELGDINRAKEEFSKAMKLTPKHNGPMPEATMQLSNLLIKYAQSRDELEEAAMYLETLIDGGYYVFQTVEAIKLEDIYYRLQLCLEKLGRNDDALDRMLQLCKINHDSHQCHFECGRLAIICQDYELAEEHLRYAIQLEPFDMHSKYYHSLSLYHLGEIDSCQQQLLTVLKHKQTDDKCLQLLARCYSRKQEWERVLEIYNKTNDTPSGQKSAFLQYQIGCVHENMNNDQVAIESFTKAVDIWKQKIKLLGFLNYFKQRPKETKAFQKIQSRCELHEHDAEWQYIVKTMFNIGMSA